MPETECANCGAQLRPTKSPSPYKASSAPCACCGVLLHGGRSSLPAGERKCQSCRTGGRAVPEPVTYVKKCARCSRLFETRHPLGKYCGDGCRGAARRESDRRRKQPTKVAEKRGPGRRGHKWRVLRERVLTEERICGICHDPIDRSIKYPHPLSPSVDHIVALSEGGAPLARDNVRAAHLHCNLAMFALNRRMRRLFWGQQETMAS